MAEISTQTGRFALPLGPVETSRRYPTSDVEALDSRFRYRIGNAPLERIASGCLWVEGPVWFGDANCLLWSDIPNNRILRWLQSDGHVDVFRSPSGFANGHTRDREGRLVSCEHAGRVTRTERDGRIGVLAERVGGRRLNAPNDVAVASDGAIWFTDPGYGIDTDYEGERRDAELAPAVYRLAPGDSEPVIVADDFVRPNGLAFSPDGTRLYIVDSGITHGGPAHIRVFDVEDGALHRGRIFAQDFAPGFTDGLRTDEHGNVWCSMGWASPEEDGVRCYAPDGDRIGRIRLPETCANLCFGGRDGSVLFMAASTSIYRLQLAVRGSAWAAR